MSYRAGLAIAVVVVLSLFINLPFPESRVAFGDVIASTKSVKSIQYIFTRVYFHELPAGGITMRSRTTGEYEMRTDVRQAVEECAADVERQFHAASTPTERAEMSRRIELLRKYTQPEQPLLEHAVRVRAMVGGLERREAIFPPASDSISNALTGRHVFIDDVDKKLGVIKSFMQSSEDAEPQPLDQLRDDVISDLTTIPKDDVVPLNSKLLNGSMVFGFRQTYPMNGGTVQKDFWVSAKTKLPVRIEKRFFENGSEKPSILGVFSDFVFDEPLAESLFSTDAPAGYEEEEVSMTFMSPEATAEEGLD